MSKNSVTSVLGVFIFAALARNIVFASTASAGASQIKGVTQQVEELKERLATKVAQLRQSERRAIYGAVKTKTLTSITIETLTKDIKIELPDDIVVIQYIKGARTKLTVDDVAKGDMVSVFGDYDLTLDLLKAKVIVIQGAVPTLVSGTVSEVNKSNFTLTIETAQNQLITIDIENATKTFRWSQEKGIEKAGFSKISLGDTIHIVGSPVPKKENRISASRILDIGNITGATPTPGPTGEMTPKASISATPKTTPKATPVPTSNSTP